MKAKEIYILFLLIAAMNCMCSTQKSNSDKNVDSLTDFYIKYCQLWGEKPLPHPDELFCKLDSLQTVFCSQRARVEAKEWFIDGHDYFTNDWGIDVESLNSLTIKKDPNSDLRYLVSYFVDSYPIAPSQPEKQEVILTVQLVEEGGAYKIDNVK